jgi:N-acetylglucosaminyl-diphospho-decaprenol L-rhamnosyltransferase
MASLRFNHSVKPDIFRTMEALFLLLDVIIVNWNGGAQLNSCLASVATARQKRSLLNRVVVVDNASSDGSADGHLDFPSLPLEVIHNTSNRGFAEACNQGANGSKADYLLFLNPDTLLEQNSLEGPIAFLERPENADIGICGIQLLDGTGEVSRSCARFPTPSSLAARSLGLDRLFPRVFPNRYLREWDHCDSRFVDQVMGAFFLVRRRAFEELCGFDQRFFVYFEDVDFSYRSRQANWRSYYLATTRAFHKGEGCTEKVRAARLFYSLRSRILYAYKHFSWAGATSVLLTTTLVEPLTRLGWAVLRGTLAEFKEILSGYWKLWQATPRLLAESRSRSVRTGAL